MISFSNDYLEGAHEKVLEALLRTNRVQASGYGTDQFTESAIEKIRKAIENPDAEVFFISGGTQTNQLAIDTMLASYEGVVAAHTGHVNVHEAGAIEFSGHKVLTVPGHDGKVDPAEVENYVRSFWADDSLDHMVFPGMLYLSHPTEYGTLYTAAELEQLSRICKTYGMRLFLDGARLGYGLAAKGTDVTLPLIARLCDAFYIGGTKVGALCGEALIFRKEALPAHIVTRIKQHGALMAKGRLIGVQFDALFTDDLYFQIGRETIQRTEQMKQIFREAGYRFYLESPTNQQFLILDRAQREALEQKVGFSFWENLDEEHCVVRFAASWSTTEEHLGELKRILQAV